MSVLLEYYNLSNKFRKRRMLKMPNIADVLDKFEALAARAESDSDMITAGLSYKAAAHCAATLKQLTHCAMLLLRAGRLLIMYPEHVDTATHCYAEAIQRFGEKDGVQAGAACRELGERLAEQGQESASVALVWLHRAVIWFRRSPMERVLCLLSILRLHVVMRNVEDAVETCRTAAKEILTQVQTPYTFGLVQELQVTHVLLLLILNPAASQMCAADSELLEHFTWDEENNGDRVNEPILYANAVRVESTTNASHTRLQSHLPDDMRSLLQSLVMTVQEGDKAGSADVEGLLAPYLTSLQRTLLRLLVV